MAKNSEKSTQNCLFKGSFFMPGKYMFRVCFYEDDVQPEIQVPPPPVIANSRIRSPFKFYPTLRMDGHHIIPLHILQYFDCVFICKCVFL